MLDVFVGLVHGGVVFMLKAAELLKLMFHDVPNFKLKNWHKEGRAMYSILSIHISPCPTRLVSFIIPLA